MNFFSLLSPQIDHPGAVCKWLMKNKTSQPKMLGHKVFRCPMPGAQNWQKCRGD